MASLTKPGALPQPTRGPAVPVYPIFFNPTTVSSSKTRTWSDVKPLPPHKAKQASWFPASTGTTQDPAHPQHPFCSSPFHHTNFTSKDTETQRHVRT